MSLDMTTTTTKLRLVQVKLQHILPGDNISRAGVEHSPHAIRRLADQIIINDYWNPPDVTPSASHRTEDKQRYRLVAGYKRIAAATLLAQEGRLPAVAGDKNGVYVYVQNRDSAASDALNAAENIVRQNLSTYQTAHTLLYLHEKHGHSPKHLSEAYGLLSKTVSNYIRAARKLIPKIQQAWLNFEDSPKPIGINKLLEWAALPPEEQLIQFESSAWAHIYKIQAEDSKPKASQKPLSNMRSRSEIESLLDTTANLYVSMTLEWVLKKRNDIDGESIGTDRDHRRSSKRSSAKGATDSPEHADTAGSSRLANQRSSSVRTDEKRRLNGTSDTPQRIVDGKLRIDESSD